MFSYITAKIMKCRDILACGYAYNVEFIIQMQIFQRQLCYMNQTCWLDWSEKTCRSWSLSSPATSGYLLFVISNHSKLKT